MGERRYRNNNSRRIKGFILGYGRYFYRQGGPWRSVDKTRFKRTRSTIRETEHVTHGFGTQKHSIRSFVHGTGGDPRQYYT